MKKGDLLIDHAAETAEDKTGIIINVETSNDLIYYYVDVAYPHGIYEVEIPKGGSDELEVLSV